VTAMDTAEMGALAALLRQTYDDASLETGVREPTVVEHDDGSRAVVLPRHDQPEPLRSLHLIDAFAAGPVLIVVFTWADDDTVFVLPCDTRELELNPSDDFAVRTFLVRLVEHTLGGPRESWEAARTTPLGPRLSVVRPFHGC
jgi:hypothetical protein